MNAPTPTPPPPPDEAPDVPGLRSWGGVYGAVITLFVLMVGLLALLPVVFA
jgi:hypothetical protein